ncbi:MAG TPA: asparagine synthase (glutamine-hydrolyzing), partial [Gemmatimonadales bacterium]|nr:asparagine synthase (glutamine-hydrolyzing) [Gemmatimonadales bacterium]
MCGIYGVVARGDAPLQRPEAGAAMGARLRHRGPDGQREWRGPHALLGATRLRIQDLTAAGDQPFTDTAAGVVLVANGEIYNAPELRKRFDPYPFRSRSDVEVILPLYLAGGAHALTDLHGMFALALWDSRHGSLVLARDRAGEKPLFRAQVGDELWFASEIAALLTHPRLSRELDQTSLVRYLTLGFIQPPGTMLAGVRSVEPGTVEVHRCGRSLVHRYWDPFQEPRRDGSTDQAVTEGRRLLAAAVQRQARAEVPVGVFASGGLDSSLVAALAAPHVPGGLTLFTAAVQAAGYDESAHAAALGRHLGARTVVVTVNDASLCQAYQAMRTISAEPLADPAVLPTFLLAREARKSVGVILSGEGADELFGGYPAYLGHRLARLYVLLPTPVRRRIGATLGRGAVSHGKVPLAWLGRLFAQSAHLPWLERHIRWIGTDLPPDIMACGSRAGAADLGWAAAGEPDAVQAAMQFDYRGYLGNRLLPKLDRATMAVGLEGRAPFLDADVTRFAWSWPAHRHVRGLTTKWLLKRVAAAHVPRRHIHRRKRGLSVPIATWLNGGFRQELDRLLDPARLRREGVFS